MSTSNLLPFSIVVIAYCSSCLVSSNTTSITSTNGNINSTILEIKSEQLKNISEPFKVTNSATTSNNSIKLNVITKSGDQNQKNVSQVYQFPQQTFETPEDLKTQEEWGGNCTLAFWDKCKVIKTWFARTIVKNDPKEVDSEVDCKLEPVLCMYNGWTVNRCHILCMGECNKEMMYRFDKYVSHEGECKAHAHG